MTTHESHKRTLAKSITWRIVATFLTFLIAIILTGQVGLALGFSALDMIFKFIGYYGHERAWDRVGWGLVKQKANEPS